MKTAFPKLERIGKRAISFLLSVLLVFQIMDFSVISIGAAEESGNLPSQNEQTEPENSETSNVESEPVEYEDWTVSSSYTLNEDKEVNNMTLNGGTLNLDGHSLIVHGNLSVYGGTLYINKGYLHCFGNIQISGYYAYLKMENVNDEIVTDGDFIWNYANSGYIKNGCIKVGGDFRDDTTGGSYNFISSEKNELILNGNSEQHIIQKNVNSYINILKLDNSSQERTVYAETPVIAGTIIKNGCNISYTVGGTYGHKLQNNETIQGDLYLVGDELDLNGKTLTITGNFIQGAGTVKVNEGKLNIAGDYIIRSYTLDENNSPVYNYSLGELIMTNKDDEVNVSGNFVMGSSKDHRNLLTNGILRVGGNFEQITVKSAYNFAPKENHEVILNGQGEQIIKFASSSYDTSHFANVEFANLTDNNIKIADGTIVIGEVSVTGGKPAGNISLYTNATLVSGSGGANINIKFPYGYKLSNDLTINGNVIANGTINLNGKQLTTNDFNAYNAEVNINNGSLICRGSLYLQNNYYYSCYLKMINELDYVRVDGDFVSENYCYDTVMSAGTLEIKGNFTQKSGVSNTNEYNFRATGTHKTVFSGTQEQTISFSSPKSYFNEVEINNTSQNGVYITSFFNHSKLTRTFGEIHFSDNTTVGETLEADKTVNDLYLGSGVYDLAGHTLTVNGNLVQSGGTMKINNGHLRVTGNYFIQKEVTENGKTIYEPSAGYLEMTNSGDIVEVDGDFVMGSVNSHADKLTNGVMTVKGNFTQKNAESNFKTSGNHKVVFDGENQQIISINSSSYDRSHFTNVGFANTSQAGIIFSEDIVVTGKVSVTGNVKLTGYICLYSTATIEDNTINADIKFPYGYTLSKNLTINGNVTANGTVNLNGKQLTTNDFNAYNAEVNINNGRLICGGSLYLKNNYYYSCYLKMINELDYVRVDGDFVSENYCYDTVMSAGTLEIKGDFTQKSGVSNTNEYNFRATGTHKTVFSGTQEQTISFSSPKSYFNEVEINNTSTEGISVQSFFNYSQIEGTVENVHFSDGSIIGETLTADKTVNDLYLGSGIYDLAGHTLTVNGNLIQSGGTMKINNGRLIVTGNYFIQKEVTENGNTTYVPSAGYLEMTNSGDIVEVDGDFVMGSVNSHANKLTNGTMTVKGDFTQKNTVDNFSTSGNHEVVFNGEDEQKISFSSSSYYSSHFMNVEFKNTSQDGITFSEDIVVTGKVSVTGNVKLTGYICLYSTATIEDNTINADIKFPYGYTLSNDLTVNGNVIANGTVNLNGNTLTANDFNAYNAEINVNNGKLICRGSLRLQNGYSSFDSCCLKMTNGSDYVRVDGDFIAENRCTTPMSAGTLEIKGDFTQRCNSSNMNEENFRATNTHETVFSGTQEQIISFSSAKSYFNKVVINNSNGIYCTNGLNASEIETNNNSIRYSDGEMLGWKLEDDFTIDSDVVLIGGNLDLDGYTLTINGNFIHKAGMVYVNGGKLIVNGNYCMQTTDKDNNNHTIPSGYGFGILKMTDSRDIVKVTGNFVANSMKSHTGMLTNGILEIGGNLSQNCSDSSENFNTSGNFTLKFNGNAKQDIYFANSYNSKIANIIFDNSSLQGVNINSSLYIINNINDQSANVHGSVYVNSLSNFTNNTFSGNVVVYSNVVMTTNITINGKLQIYGDYNSCLDMNGFTVNAGSIDIYKGLLKINNGQVNCSGGFIINSNGKLEMTKAQDGILVGGDFEANSNYSHSGILTHGVLEIKGDFFQRGSSESFTCSGEHKVILSGKSSSAGRIYRQTITFNSPNHSKFNYLVLTVPVDYYSINADIDGICKQYTLEIRDTEPPSTVEGLTAVSRSASSVTLSWNPSFDDIEVIGYDVYRDDSRIATVSGTQYTDTNLVPETLYNYKVCAFDEVRNLSGYSQAIAVSTIADTVSPSVPQSLKVKNRTGTAITLSWQPSNDNVGCTGYQIYRNGEFLVAVGNVNTYKDTGLSASTLYIYKIKALDNVGNSSDFSEEVSGYVAAPHINSIYPAEYTVFYGNTVNLSVRFANMGNSEGNSVKFEYSLDEYTWQDIVSYPCVQQTYSGNELYAAVNWNITGFASGNYFVRATLYDADGSTDTQTAEYTIDHTVPDAIQNFSANSSNGVVNLSWSASAEADFSYYELLRSTSANGTFESIGRINNQNTVYFPNGW